MTYALELTNVKKSFGKTEIIRLRQMPDQLAGKPAFAGLDVDEHAASMLQERGTRHDQRRPAASQVSPLFG